MDRLIYYLAREADWQAASDGRFTGSAADRADGFIHFSTAAQVAESAARHRAGEAGLLLVEVDALSLGEALWWEPARGGQLFPHLYGDLPLAAVTRTWPLPLGPDGRHLFPPLDAPA
ncbi:MAG: DUF952 domain-containing protein [Thalassobaculales bacterium]